MRRGTIRDRGRRLRIGLVNNMPDAAAAGDASASSRSLLEAASGDFDVRLVLVYARQRCRASRGVREAMAGAYRAPAPCAPGAPDAIIVTGAEPRAPELSDEPYLDELTALIDWARRGTISSALFLPRRAHAAALHRDGVARRRRSRQVVRRVRVGSGRGA